MKNNIPSFDELAILLIKSAPETEDLTIVGGRAVQYWTAFYQQRYPELFEDLDIRGTRDLDYVLKTKASMDRCIETWNKKLEIMGYRSTKSEVPLGDHSPEVGHGSIEVDPNASRENRWFMVDFLFDLHGISKDKIYKNRVPQRAPWQTSHYILNEYMTLANRAFNVAGIPGKDDEKGLSQLRQAIAINKAYMLSLLESATQEIEVRSALKEINKVSNLAIRKDIGVKISAKYEISMLDAIPSNHHQLPQEFKDRGWPQTCREFNKRVSSLKGKWDRFSHGL